MTSENIFWNLERSFWVGGSDFYRDHMAKHAIMVFPGPAGIMSGDEIIEALDEAPRWDEVSFEDKQLIENGNFAMLSYRADGRREGSKRYSALCASGYFHDGEGWRLVSHHQSPN